MDMDDMINRFVERCCKVGCRLIGSWREGFRFELLDYNYVFYVRDNIIIVDLFNLDNINIFNLNIVFMEYIEIFLGYVKLNFLILIRGIV